MHIHLPMSQLSSECVCVCTVHHSVSLYPGVTAALDPGSLRELPAGGEGETAGTARLTTLRTVGTTYTTTSRPLRRCWIARRRQHSAAINKSIDKEAVLYPDSWILYTTRVTSKRWIDQGWILAPSPITWTELEWHAGSHGYSCLKIRNTKWS